MARSICSSRTRSRFNVRYMRYVGTLTAEDGTTYYFEGHKTVHNDPGFDVWSDTTTLFVTVYAGQRHYRRDRRAKASSRFT